MGCLVFVLRHGLPERGRHDQRISTSPDHRPGRGAREGIRVLQFLRRRGPRLFLRPQQPEAGRIFGRLPQRRIRIRTSERLDRRPGGLFRPPGFRPRVRPLAGLPEGARPLHPRLRRPGAYHRGLPGDRPAGQRPRQREVHLPPRRPGQRPLLQRSGGPR